MFHQQKSTDFTHVLVSRGKQILVHTNAVKTLNNEVLPRFGPQQWYHVWRSAVGSRGETAYVNENSDHAVISRLPSFVTSVLAFFQLSVPCSATSC